MTQQSAMLLLASLLKTVSMLTIADGHGDKTTMKSEQKALESEFEKAQTLAAVRMDKLHAARDLFRFVTELEELEREVLDKQRACQSFKPGRDMVSLVAAQQKHKALEGEIRAAHKRFQGICARGTELALKIGGTQTAPIAKQLKDIEKHFEILNKVSFTNLFLRIGSEKVLLGINYIHLGM